MTKRSIADSEDSQSASTEARRQPLARFIQVAPEGRTPRRADRSVGGTLPVRALRYCEPVSAASTFGWHVFLPCRFRLLWDGTETFFNMAGMDDTFLPLRSVVYPGMTALFDKAAPDDMCGYEPAFLATGPSAGVVQVWTGAMVRTAPGWSLLVRPVANLARPTGYEIFEGIIETDTWFGPLFTNIRLTRTDVPIEFDDDIPFMQVQPLRKGQYEEDFLADYEVESDVASLSEQDWDAYRSTVVKPSQSHPRRLGGYAAKIRKAYAGRQRKQSSGEGEGE